LCAFILLLVLTRWMCGTRRKCWISVL